jgi:hypothetical protein
MDSREGGCFKEVQILTGEQGKPWSMWQIAGMAQVTENACEIPLQGHTVPSSEGQFRHVYVKRPDSILERGQIVVPDPVLELESDIA